MRLPGEEEAAGQVDARGLVAGAGAEGARARSLRAARSHLPPGGKAMARLEAFLEQRGVPLSGNGARGLAPAVRGGTAPGQASYQESLLAPRPRPRGAAAAGQPQWKFLGPRWIPHGQTYGEGPGSTPPVAGRVGALAVDPSDSRHLLVGSARGGVWETRNQGRTWQPRTDHQPTLGIGAVAFNPADPSKAYAGTGEGNASEVPGLGLLVSTDGGTTWTLTATHTFVGSFFYDLAVDPGDGSRLFAATTAGVFRSVDSGATWTQVQPSAAWDVSVHPGSTGEVFAACGDGLFHSTDGGSSWSRVNLPGGPSNFTDDIGRLAVAHAPSNGAVAYAFGALGNPGWLWRRSSAGGSFAKIALPSPLDLSQSWYDWCLAVAPNDPDTVYIAAIEAFRGHRSSSGQWSWDNISSRSTGDSIHPDHHTIVFDPQDPKVVYFGNDGGIFRSPDGGDTWEPLNKGLAITEFEYLAQHPRYKKWIIGGTQDNGTLRNRGDRVWLQVALGDGGDCGVNRSSPSTCYHSYYGMSLERSRSAGDPDSWEDVTPPVSDAYRALFYPPVEVNGSTVTKAGESVYVSDDEGDTWHEITLPPGGLASAVAFASPTRLLVGMGTRQDGRVFRIDRNGGGWGSANQLARPRPGYVSDLLADPTRPDRYWATYSDLGGGHVYLSTDGGGSWQDVSANLPDIPVNAIEIDADAPDTAWIASDVGVFRSTNRGRSWSVFGTGLPRALAVDLLFHKQLRLLRAGTRSRGVWEIKVD